MATIYPTKTQFVVDAENTWRIKFEYYNEFGNCVRVEVKRRRHSPKWYQRQYEMIGFTYVYKQKDEEKFSDLVQKAYNEIIKNYYIAKEETKELDNFFLNN